jgi:hypothetical protein
MKRIAQKAHDGIWCKNAYVWRRSGGNRWKHSISASKKRKYADYQILYVEKSRKKSSENFREMKAF